LKTDAADGSIRFLAAFIKFDDFLPDRLSHQVPSAVGHGFGEHA
jgi:hypothetical protein